QSRLIAIAGLLALGMVGLPAFIYHAGPPPSDWRWVVAFAAFGSAFAADLRLPRLMLLLVESAAAIALVLLRCNGYEGTLLAVIAMQLGARTGRRAGRLWVGAQSLLLIGATAIPVSPKAALLLTQGPSRWHVETSRAMARQLLAEVREIVADSAARDGVQLAEALQTLASAVPRPAVHLEIADGLRLADPERAHILLRCAQEIVTNAARHSDAENLWIVIRREDGAILIKAHDDGRGSERSDG